MIFIFCNEVVILCIKSSYKNVKIVKSFYNIFKCIYASHVCLCNYTILLQNIYEQKHKKSRLIV